MATTSFNKEFVVTDEKSIQRIRAGPGASPPRCHQTAEL